MNASIASLAAGLMMLPLSGVVTGNDSPQTLNAAALDAVTAGGSKACAGGCSAFFVIHGYDHYRGLTLVFDGSPTGVSLSSTDDTAEPQPRSAAALLRHVPAPLPLPAKPNVGAPAGPTVRPVRVSAALLLLNR